MYVLWEERRSERDERKWIKKKERKEREMKRREQLERRGMVQEGGRIVESEQGS